MICAHCGRSEVEHSVAEREKAVNHQFSETGSTLLPLKPNEVETPTRGINRTPADPVLRYLLVSKGVITSDELMDAEKILAAMGVLKTDVGNTRGSS